MSNPFAVAAVTATFSQLLGRVIEEPSLSGADVTTVPPDVAGAATAARRLNLFLYQITTNAALRSADLPVRRADGRLRDAPITALNLHYLVTAFGANDDELDAHHLLAHAMSLVNDEPVLTPASIKAAIAAEGTVADADLADQTELVRLCPETLSMDDLSKLWGMFQDTHYRLSVGYEASVVLVQRRHATAVAPPVHRSGLFVIPLRRPVIDTVSPPIVPVGGALVISGRNLRADDVQVLIGGSAVVPVILTDRRIEVTVSANTKAGMTAVQVTHRVAMGQPPAPHRGFESNTAAFILAPRITTPPPITVARGAGLGLSFEPAVTRAQKLSVVIGDREIAIPPETVGDVPVTSMSFPVPAAFPVGTYLLRLRVDGAESLLEVDDDSTSPTFDQFVGPNVTVT